MMKTFYGFNVIALMFTLYDKLLISSIEHLFFVVNLNLIKTAGKTTYVFIFKEKPNC